MYSIGCVGHRWVGHSSADAGFAAAAPAAIASAGMGTPGCSASAGRDLSLQDRGILRLSDNIASGSTSSSLPQDTPAHSHPHVHPHTHMNTYARTSTTSAHPAGAPCACADQPHVDPQMSREQHTLGIGIDRNVADDVKPRRHRMPCWLHILVLKGAHGTRLRHLSPSSKPLRRYLPRHDEMAVAALYVIREPIADHRKVHALCTGHETPLLSL